tara:strand:- start:9 stop:851 length:843 start_codon:yes stop_codon:yes gene_type:complete
VKKNENMSFFEHIEELRERLTVSLAVFVVGFMLCYFWTNSWVMDFLRQPLFEILPEGEQKLYFTSLFENFLTHLKIAGYSALFFLSPYFFFQIWKFIEPGLYEKEKKFLIPFVFAATIFFTLGAGFAYYVLFPIGFKFFVTFGFESDKAILTIDSYYSTALKLMLLFGMAFELPVLVVFFGYLGLIDAKFLRTHRRNAILGITVACAMFAPPDAISMLMLMAPLILFYEGAIVVVSMLGAKRKQRDEEENEKQGAVDSLSEFSSKDGEDPWGTRSESDSE